MIIRRKHTRNFTTIGNALFEDERLEVDEIGTMAWLLSRPPDWEVRRPALMRRLKIGREGLRRVIRNCIRFGWIVAKVTRLSNGTISIVYEVRDEAGPTLSEDEVKAALSLVSSGAGSGDSDDDEGAEHGPDADPGGGSPGDGQPEAASRLRQAVGGPIEDSLKTDSVKTESPNGAWAFSDVLKLWPSDHVVSPFACEKLHVELTETLQQAAFNGVRPYLEDCKASSRKVCDLGTYYRERRWERFLAIRPAGQMAVIKAHTPNFYRWREYYVATGDLKATSGLDTMAKLGRDITVPSPWPPAMPNAPPGENAA